MTVPGYLGGAVQVVQEVHLQAKDGAFGDVSTALDSAVILRFSRNRS